MGFTLEFIDKSSKPLEIEDKINFTLVMTQYAIETRDQISVKGYGFLSFAKNFAKNLSKNVSRKYIYS